MARARGAGSSVARKRPQAVARIRAVAPRSAAVRHGGFDRSRVAPARVTGTGKASIRIPKINIQVPNVGKGIGDAFSHFAPQDVLFKQIGNRLKNPK